MDILEFNKKWSTKELGGALLFYNLEDSFEVQRSYNSSQYAIYYKTCELTEEEMKHAFNAYRNSNCVTR